MTTPRIYVACLASYNSGKLHGSWIDAGDLDVMLEEIQEMLRQSPVPGAEEYEIHDTEGFEGLRVTSVEKAAELARLIEEHDGAYVAYVNLVGDHYATEDGFNEMFLGHAKSTADYAQDFHEATGTDLGSLAHRIDWEGVATDLEHDGYRFVDDGSGGVYVFGP